MRHEHTCGAIILHDGKVLLVKTHEGLWYLPKGHVHKKESDETCAKREVKEETGLTIEVIPGFKESITYESSPGVLKRATFFLGTTKDFSIRTDGIELFDYTLLPMEDAIKKANHENTKELLRKARDYIKKHKIKY